MKSEIKEIGNNRYPVLKHYKEIVVLFTGPGVGTIVYSNNDSNPVGRYVENCDESIFEYFAHEILLSN